MADLEKMFDKLIKPMSTEIKSRGMNSSVIGGFDRYVLDWSQKIKNKVKNDKKSRLAEKLSKIFSDYEAASLEERQKKLKMGVEVINQLAVEIKGQEVLTAEGREKKVTSVAGKKKQQADVSKEKALTLTKETSSVKEKLPDFWQQSIRYAKGVGEYRAKKFKKLDVEAVGDLLYCFPRDYNDWSSLKKIANLNSGMKATVEGKVVEKKKISPRKKLKIVKIGISDGSGILYGVWFNQEYMLEQFERGERIFFSGEVEYNYGNLEINNPQYEGIEGANLHTGRIVPVYSTTKGLNQKRIRQIVWNVLEEYGAQVPEFLPAEVRKRHSLLSLSKALREIHFPCSKNQLKKARKRFAYEELFILQLGLALRKEGVEEKRVGLKHTTEGNLANKFRQGLNFSLTSAQESAWQDIKDDMEASSQMNRLLQGDVGAGKTVVATMALLKAVESDFQGALMAPTEILAEQHCLKLMEELESLGVDIELLIGSLTQRQKEESLKRIKEGSVDIIIGTHALIQEKIDYDKLGLVITDEQHRFGVRQRAILQEKGTNPDVLVMTATPIPRTLALTVYGDLDVSVIDELPPGRKPVVTEWRTKKARAKIYEFVREQVKEGRQGYIVCPLVEESDKLEVEAAEELFKKLQGEVLSDLNLGLLHGQLKAGEKEEVMEAFRQGELDILVATTVIEVGVDVANATIMVIEDAQRFGLAQLHQLRGRVGRGKHQSYCILVAEPGTEDGKKRMKIMSASNDGFEIAEEDLYIRGPGEFFGTRQHGMPDLQVADILRDQKLLELAREDAFRLVKQADDLKLSNYKLLKKFLRETFKYDLDLIEIS